jgi:hypothetical protein
VPMFQRADLFPLRPPFVRFVTIAIDIRLCARLIQSNVPQLLRSCTNQVILQVGGVLEPPTTLIPPILLCWYAATCCCGKVRRLEYLLSNAEDELALTNVGAEGNLLRSSTDLRSHLCDQWRRLDAVLWWCEGKVDGGRCRSVVWNRGDRSRQKVKVSDGLESCVRSVDDRCLARYSCGVCCSALLSWICLP